MSNNAKSIKLAVAKEAELRGWEVVSLNLYKQPAKTRGKAKKLEEVVEINVRFSLSDQGENEEGLVIEARYEILAKNPGSYCCDLVARAYFDHVKSKSREDREAFAYAFGCARLYDKVSTYLKMATSYGLAEPLSLPPFKLASMEPSREKH